ncbi:carbohydrate ABC transporter permease [Cohnella sp. GCM10020058]|uniref:carbohydrate ABC transporter permease n=1 Tax=Cohnella sp. GCM10020058 TaxID=3317330 RepID=UPI0036289633
MRSGYTHTKAVLYLLLAAVAIVCLVPFYSMMITSTHANSDIASRLLLWPGTELANNYERLVGSVHIWRGFANTVFLAVTGTALSVYFAAAAGFGFSKYRFRYRGFLFLFVLGTMMIPGQLGIIGFFKVMSMLHLTDTYWPMLLQTLYDAFGIFLMRQFADASIPDEIVESARIDGCGEFRIFHRIVLPLMGPAIATLAIFTFIGKWNDFLTPMIILFDNDKQTLPVMIASVKSAFSSDFGAQYVGIAISVVPLLVFFAVMSKQIISGVAAGAVKG